MTVTAKMLGDAMLAYAGHNRDTQGYVTGKVFREFTLRAALVDWLYLRNGMIETHAECERKADEMACARRRAPRTRALQMIEFLQRLWAMLRAEKTTPRPPPPGCTTTTPAMQRDAFMFDEAALWRDDDPKRPPERSGRWDFSKGKR